MNQKIKNYLFYGLLVLALGSYFAYMKGWILVDFESISAQQAEHMIASENVLIVDVRTPEEFTQAHLENAISIPLSNLEENLPPRSMEKKLIVYCQSGNRSVAASRILAEKGYQPLNLKGGISAWSQSGYPVVR